MFDYSLQVNHISFSKDNSDLQRGNTLSSLTFLFMFLLIIVVIIIIIIIIVWLNRHLINQNTLRSRMNLLHLYGFYICSLLQLR